MSQANASPNWRDSGQPQPAVARRTHPRPAVGWWWWVQIGVLCVLIGCAVTLIVVLLLPMWTIHPRLLTLIGYTPSAGAQPPLTGATLGGTLAGFDVAYGAPTYTSGGGARWEHAAIAGQQVALAIAFAAGQDEQDGPPHVTGASVSPAAHVSATWDTATAQRIMAALLPSDSRLIRTDSSHPNTLTQVYTSALLGQTLPPAQTASAGAANGPDGEFNVTCQSTTATQISYCFVVAGAP